MYSVHRISAARQTGKVDLAGYEIFFPHEIFPSPSDSDPKARILGFLRFVLEAEPNEQSIQVVRAINVETAVAALETFLDLIREPICQSSQSVNKAMERTVALLGYCCAWHDAHAGRPEWFNILYPNCLGNDLRWMDNPQLQKKAGRCGQIVDVVISQVEQSAAGGRFRADIDGLSDRLKPPPSERELLSNILEEFRKQTPAAPPLPAPLNVDVLRDPTTGNAGEPDLPPLSAARRRLLDRHIEKIKKRLGITGAHVNWPRETERRQRARELRIRPVEDGDGMPAGVWYIDRITEKPVANQADLDALLNDPATVDVVGLIETVTLIVDVFDAFAGVFLSIWATGPDPHYEEFGAWLEPIRRQAIERCRAEWPDRSEWFDRLPLGYANTEIDAALEIWRSKALNSEIERLETSESGGTEESQESLPASSDTSETPSGPPDVPTGGSLPKPPLAPPASETLAVTHETVPAPTKRRRPSTITSLIAAQRMEAYMNPKGFDFEEFGSIVGASGKTLRSFANTGIIQRRIAKNIAIAMGTNLEELLKSD